MPWRARVTEDIQDHLRRPPVRHPVLGVHQQRIAAPTEHALDGFDQLHSKQRGGRHDDGRGVVQQGLL
ncbi:hypothetical protein D3C77_614940 [compost metagenome]